MLTRSEFDRACKDLIAKYASISHSLATSPMKGWSWNEHSSVSGFGYMSRDVTRLKRVPSIDDPDFCMSDTAEPDEATMNTSIEHEIFTCRQYIVFSATFQVPCFYFNVYNSGGTPLSLDGMLETTLFRPYVVESTDRTSFSIGQHRAPFPLLSQGDHPTLGTPCWYFHPCETEVAVGELMAEKSESNTSDLIETWICVLGSVVDLRI
ncbi:hypothetical protein K435DRAFT_959174 [Dendrothele bispora CBS 962.96]|uniref:Ubiquitin-like-conjugating enzyme ATG10 n=1 Tax=Dendrothele bispora (strain CBS 962.96) TaxID=1314807 RepID=A0A4V4HJ02_DENBC|nr:hypothetical protein K435DRAFT_959174 [Dendrothele bispora CBS 962.96]